MSPPTMNARLTELQAEVERLRDKGHTGTTTAPDPAELARKLREIRSGYTHDHLSDSTKEALRQAETFLEQLASTQPKTIRSEEHTSELQSLMRISYAVFCLKKKKNEQHKLTPHQYK